MNTPINFAHRGASAYCPENTMAAFARAVELGATGIETDIQRTKDGKLVCIHDDSLLRTAGLNRLVNDTDYEELSHLDAGSWFDPSFSGERVPTLDQLLQLAAQSELILNLELKNGVVLYPGMEAEVIAAVREAGLANRVVLSSFNHYSLALCKQLAPDIRTGILYMEGLFRPWEYAATLKADALHAYHYAVLPEWVHDAAEAGIVYHPFTVNEDREMVRLIEAGVAGIITDYPDRLNALLAERG
ncbi:glycerophosphodiester phosphodiesterase [Paenibacillus sp. LHD-117]|uniref:glycerophosphodiester phosphodiesterase n=1 Tax=Paenibacillus sp. LHD-117 TaxID=3071412 RepID=UPI0027DFF620|nr:glycerophosphodiester phosphodiesterase [Paenibacillus sp. LHD-117]MDQ6421360.1 glycerophosphodiester phosphodiesterase [Paenibacillus sp. LHD-117]